MRQLTTLFVCLAFPIAIAGCSSPFKAEMITPQVTADPSVMKDNAGRQISDEIAKYAVSVPPGSSGMVYLPKNRKINVRVGTDYIAATGENCRKVTLDTVGSETLISAVCEINSVWKTVLWPVAN